MRTAVISRASKETDIKIKLNIDGKGKYNIKTPINFFTHMLEAVSKHGLFGLEMSVRGDVHVDQHHTIEDSGILLGQAFKKALGDKRGINRSGFFAFPMDDSLAIIAVDIGGRPYLKYKTKFKRRKCGDIDTDAIEHFFLGFTMGLSCNLAVYVPYGKDDHHKIEAIFKAFGKAMKMACSKEKRAIKEIPSTKGLIDSMN